MDMYRTLPPVIRRKTRITRVTTIATNTKHSFYIAMQYSQKLKNQQDNLEILSF